MSFITIRDLTTGADFGAQMMVCSGLYSVSKHTGHIPSIITNKDNEGYKLRILPEIFPNFYSEFERINYLDYKWEWMDINTSIFKDDSVYNLDRNKNYNFPVSFSTYHYWINEFESNIKNLFEFNSYILDECKHYVSCVKEWGEGNEVIGVHFRRGDYLKVSSLNLNLEYYYKALEKFNDKKYTLLIFSNTLEDIEWVENNFKPGNNYSIFRSDSYKYPQRLDMCMMSLCDHNIIANSSYSWWGAFLNKKEDKKVICPYNYLNVPSLNHINGNWFLKEWTSINY